MNPGESRRICWARSSAGNESWPSCRCARLRRWLASPTRISPRSSMGSAPHRPMCSRRLPRPWASHRKLCVRGTDDDHGPAEEDDDHDEERPSEHASFVAAISTDPGLTARQRRALTEIYTAMTETTADRRRRRSS